jgi:hypothetical protein
MWCKFLDWLSELIVSQYKMQIYLCGSQTELKKKEDTFSEVSLGSFFLFVPVVVLMGFHFAPILCPVSVDSIIRILT